MSYKIYIIESPNDIDILQGRKEGDTLQCALKQAGIEPCYYLVVSKDALGTALDCILEAIEADPGQIPIIHISCHGSEDGLQLTDSMELTWELLSKLMSELNAAAGGKLVLALSTCWGLHGLKQVSDSSPAPFSIIVGPWEKIEWQDSLIAFVVFYHLFIHKSCDPRLAAATMGQAAGLSDAAFKAITAAEFLSVVQMMFQKETEAVRRERIHAMLKALGTAALSVRSAQ